MGLGAFMKVLVAAVAALAVGLVLPALSLGDGAGEYEGEDRAFAEFVLVLDDDLKEWPFPVDPTVVSRVQEVRVRPGDNRGCTTAGGPRTGPYFTGHFSGDYSAEVVHYGPFFVPTGKNVFRCDVARTYAYPDFGTSGPLWAVGGFLLVGWFFFTLLVVPTLPGILLIGGAALWRRGGRGDRAVAVVALVEGVLVLVAGASLVALFVASSYL